MHTMHSNFPSDSMGEVYAVVLRTYCAACIGWYFTYLHITVTSTVIGVTKVFLIFHHSLQNHTGIITKATHMLCFMHWPCKYESYFVAYMFDTTRGVHAAKCCIKFKWMHSLLFFHMPRYLDTHQVLLKLSIQYQAILLGYGNSPVSQWNCLPQYSPVSLKSASPTETVRAATLWIHFLFNIWDAETEFIGFLGVICGTALFAQGELHPFMSLLKWAV